MAMTIAQVLEGVEAQTGLTPELAAAPVSGLEYDSRRVEAGQLFFAFLGQRFDGRRFAPQARERGAVAVVCETPQPDYDRGPWIQVAHGRKALAVAARNFYREAASAVAVTGITGTNGKTTTAYLLDSVLRAAGKTTAMIGTIEYLMAGEPRPAPNTTPESLDVYRMLEELRRLGGTHATMEVSSHALDQGRVYGLPFHTAVFTNLSRDHLDYHGTMEAYFAAKCLLFQADGRPAPPFAVINADDEWGAKIPLTETANILRYGQGPGADVQAVDVSAGFEGLRFRLLHGGEVYEVESPLLGRVNVYNILAAFAAGLTYDLEPEVILHGIRARRSVPGRFERIDEGQPFLVIIDYAHTDDALRNVLAASRDLKPKRILTVFGCGGDRDRTKRPLMGEAAAQGSDFVVLTSDNPRSEDPLTIMNDALVGLRRYDVPHRIEPDRETAIRIALAEANAGDLVLIAGKGHETYQVLKDRTIPFDDREVARRLLREFGYGKEVS